jgi:hypothetical protein|tara:strand:+ start:438 stop:635 length:198 start_codon:yes stop_codon:yes gene_type:complete
MKRIIKKRARNTSTAHQRIDDHEKLCRIMQEVTNKKIDRLEKIVMTSTGMLIMGMSTIIYKLLLN